MKITEVRHWIGMLEELQQDTIMRLEGNDELIGIAVSIAEHCIEKQVKLERCLDVMQQTHESMRYANDWAVVNKLLHDFGRYKKSE